MTYGFSTGLANKVVDAMCNGGGGISFFDSGILDIYTAPRASSPDAVATGTKLATMTLPANAVGPSAGRVVAMLGAWQTAAALASGTAFWFRFKTASDTGVVSQSEYRMDGSLTVRGGGGDLTLGTLVIVSGQPVAVNSYVFGLPA